MAKRMRESQVEDLNLIPLMNLFVTMIPLLLLTAAFYHIGMVSVSVPTQGPTGDADTSKNAVTMSVRMTDKGLVLSASNDAIGEDALKALEGTIPKKNGKHDLARLTAQLQKIKRQYPESKTMMLLPGKKSSYEEMINTMDAARDMKITAGGKKRRLALFPVVVVTTLVQ